MWCLCDLVPSVAGAVVYFLNLSAMAWPDACHHVWSKLPRCLRDALGCEGSIPSPDVLAYLFDSEQDPLRLLGRIRLSHTNVLVCFVLRVVRFVLRYLVHSVLFCCLVNSCLIDVLEQTLATAASDCA